MVDLEHHLLSALLFWPGALADVAGILKPEDFEADRNGCIYGHMLRLSAEGRGVDGVTLEAALRQAGQTSYADALLGLSEYATSQVMALEYAKLIRESAIRKRMRLALVGALEAAKDPTRPLEEVVAMAEAAAMHGAQREARAELRPAGDYLEETFRILLDQSKGKITGLRTGFIDLDKQLGGLQKGDLIVLAARPGMGKTSLALDIAANVSMEQKKTVAFFEVEMSGRAVIERLLFARTKLNGQTLKAGRMPEKEIPKLIAMKGPIRESGLYLDETVGITPLQVLSKCRRIKGKRGLDLLVVDCLQKMKGDGKYGGNKRLEVSDISLHLKNMAKDLDVPIIAISHLSREVEKRGDKVPELSDLHESGNIEQDADIVMLLFRKDEYFQVEDKEQGKADVIFAKYRNGETGIRHLHFQKEFATFSDWSGRTDAPPEKRSDSWYGPD